MYNIAQNTPDRRGTSCTKWDGIDKMFGRNDLLPLSIADMDFATAPCITEALAKRVEHGIFGYTLAEDGYYNAFIKWQRERFNWDIKREWIRFSPGIVGALYWWVNILTNPGDACMVLTPVYYMFMTAIKDTGRRVVSCELVNDHNRYSLDLEAFERTIIENDVKLYMLCSPHNPVGRVWTADELRAMMDICKKHGVYVISDEIHQDIIIGDYKQISTATLGGHDEILITTTSLSKTFNLAGFKNSFMIIKDDVLREKWDNFVKVNRLQNGSMMGYIATRAAYEGGVQWLCELLDVIRDNDAFVRSALTTALPKIEIAELQATYLMWVDLSAYIAPEELESVILDQCKLGVDLGKWFFDGRDDSHIRINLATSKEVLSMAVQRLVDVLKNK